MIPNFGQCSEIRRCLASCLLIGALLANGFDVSTTAFLVRLSAPLTEEFRQLYKSSRPALHRQRELNNFLKKSPLAQPPTSVQRFDAVQFRWVGGDNWTDNPTVQVQRQDASGSWTPYAASAPGYA